MGVLANVGADDVENAITVGQAVQGWFPSALAAFTFLVFNLLDSPCLAAIATMAQQMQSRKWFWFAIAFQNIFAYLVCLSVYQIGSFVMGGAFGIGTAAGFIVAIIFLILLFRPDPYKKPESLYQNFCSGSKIRGIIKKAGYDLPWPAFMNISRNYY
mgnify:CR=1 FL=1